MEHGAYLIKTIVFIYKLTLSCYLQVTILKHLLNIQNEFVRQVMGSQRLASKATICQLSSFPEARPSALGMGDFFSLSIHSTLDIQMTG